MLSTGLSASVNLPKPGRSEEMKLLISTLSVLVLIFQGCSSLPQTDHSTTDAPEVDLSAYFTRDYDDQAATYYVSKFGSDANSCATARIPVDTNAKLTIQAGLCCLSAGDTLMIGSGRYYEELPSSKIVEDNVFYNNTSYDTQCW